MSMYTTEILCGTRHQFNAVSGDVSRAAARQPRRDQQQGVDIPTRRTRTETRGSLAREGRYHEHDDGQLSTTYCTSVPPWPCTKKTGSAANAAA
jgi:hypothetical protein